MRINRARAGFRLYFLIFFNGLAMSKDSQADIAESRGSRRKRRTREKLLHAAMELMADRGAEGVAINEITERADVGFGTFYNHFPSKEAIYEALIHQVFDDFADDIDVQTKDMDDPAAILALSVQLSMARAAQDELWGRLLMRESLTPAALTRGLGQRLTRDILIGVQQKRFASDDVVATFVSVSGTVIMGILAQQIAGDPASPMHQLSNIMGTDMKDLGPRIAASVLTTLGLSAEEARQVAAAAKPEG